MNQTFKKEERLCSFTAINDLVKNGVALFHYPFRVVYLVKEGTAFDSQSVIMMDGCVEELHAENLPAMEYKASGTEEMVDIVAQERCLDKIAEGKEAGTAEESSHRSYNKILISVPKKNFKRAVKRNLLKRRIRESYRKNKALLSLPENINVNFMLVYVSKDLLEYSYIERKLKEVLGKISEEVKIIKD